MDENNPKSETKNYLKSKPRFDILDGLRGIASIIVIIFHFFEVYSFGNPAEQKVINHGYLAVDFFYLLSGFVIGYAYDDRWNKMSYIDFYKRRLIRLHPMVIAGTFFGIGYYFLSESEAFPLVETISPIKLILAIIFCLLNIPTPVCLDVRGYNEINALISTSWTLQFEYLINILYSLIIRRLHTYIIAILSLLSAFLTINLTLNLDVFGVLKERELRRYTVIGGWELSSCELYIGFARLFYPFFVGYLIFRLKLKIKIKYSFLITSLLLTIVLCFPRIGGDNWIINGIYESVIILVIFPLIIMIGAGTTQINNNIIKLCNILGELSYPLYITHYPLVHCFMAWNCYHSKDKLFNKIGLSIGTSMLIIFNAYAALKLFDEPVRKWLINKYILKEKKIEKEIIKEKLK